MNLPVFEKIYITQASESSEVAKRIINLYPSEIIKFVHDESEVPLATERGRISAEDFNSSKKQLLLTTFKGQFFKRCPGATQKKTLTCCNYHVLNLGSQCNMNCSYCYLQSYLNSPITKIFTNIEQALIELETMASEHPDQPFRVGTGEVMDSLSLDELTLYSIKLIEFFKKYPKWILEFKTKSDKIDQFIEHEHAGNIVVSWSINPQYVISKEEHGTASIKQRLNAAKKCLDTGFKIAFHIDPMIWHPEWKENYSELVHQVTAAFGPKDVFNVSLGTLRFQPEQRHIMRERFGLDSLVTTAEMFPSEGAKLRYDAGVRAEMFQFVRSEFLKNSQEWSIFLCMETPETWIKTFEKVPMQLNDLKPVFKQLPEISKIF